ncbi:MAG: hypothetical protein ACRYGF_14525 [Janthinobacterium lividum]
MKDAAYKTALTTLLSLAAATLYAQTPPEVGQITRTFHLSSQMNQAEQNDTLTAIRNTVPPTLRIFLVSSQNAIVVRGVPDQVQIVADLVGELDRPHRQYRLTYTLTETDGGKRIGVQHYSMVLTSGERMQMKEGSRIPVVTGSLTSSDQTTRQNTYLDVGLNFDSVVQEYGSGVQLKARVEQSSLAAEKSGIGPEDPIVRQTRLEGTSFLTEGKPLSLGTLDVISSTRRLEIEALVEPVR